jgi:hypothetical protein
VKKQFDFRAKQIKIVSRNGVLLFWGVTTSCQRGVYQPFQMIFFLENDRGDGSVYNRFIFKLKVVVTVVGGFVNSPIAKARIKVFFFVFLIFLLWRSKQYGLGSVVAASNLFPIVLSKGGSYEYQ